MGTRATISIANSDGSIHGIYTHWDGYITHHGPLLLEHYNTEEKIRALIALGAISMLDKSIEKPEGVHDFENRQDGYTLVFARDRDDDNDFWDLKAPNLDVFMNKSAEDYNYIWSVNGNCWSVIYKNEMHQLTDALIREERIRESKT